MGSGQSERERVRWRKASRSVGNGACVEIAALKGSILVRDSKIPESPVITYSTGAWQSFLSGLKAK